MKVNIPKGNVLCGKCKNFWVRDENQRDCPYCEIDRLRENIKHDIDVDQARFNVEMENAILREALEYMASEGCSMDEPCVVSNDRDEICFACCAKLALQQVGGRE